MNLCRNARIAIKLSDSEGPELQATILILIFSIPSFTFDFSLSHLSHSHSCLPQPVTQTRWLQWPEPLTYGRSDRIITVIWSFLPWYFWDNYTYCMNVDIRLGTCGCLFFTVCLFICCCVCCHDHSNVLACFVAFLIACASFFFFSSAVVCKLSVHEVKSYAEQYAHTAP